MRRVAASIRRSRRPSARLFGITLVEVMIAVAIVAMVMTMIYSGFSQTSKNRIRLQERLDRHHVIHAALHRMSRELQTAFVSAHLNPNQPLQTVRTAFVGQDRGSGDRLDFCSFSHQRLFRNAHESDQNEISYFLSTIEHRERDEVRTVKALLRREDNRIDDKPQQGGDVGLLVPDVIGLDFEYLDPRSGEWVREWNTTNAGTGAPNLLPAQVKIMLEVPHTFPVERRRGRTQTFATRVSLPIRYGLNHAIYNP